MTDEQKQEMFQAPLKQLVTCIQMKTPPDMRDRFLTSTFAYHMMRAEGRKNCNPLNKITARWVTRHQPELNQTHEEFRAFLRAWIAEGERREATQAEAALRQQKYVN